MEKSPEQNFILSMNELRDSIVILNNIKDNNISKEESEERVSYAGKMVKNIITSTREMDGYQEVMSNKKTYKIFTNGWFSILFKTIMNIRPSKENEKKDEVPSLYRRKKFSL